MIACKDCFLFRRFIIDFGADTPHRQVLHFPGCWVIMYVLHSVKRLARTPVSSYMVPVGPAPLQLNHWHRQAYHLDQAHQLLHLGMGSIQPGPGSDPGPPDGSNSWTRTTHPPHQPLRSHLAQGRRAICRHTSLHSDVFGD